MDGFTLLFMTHELQENLLGGRVDKINQPEQDVLLIMIRSQGANHRLLLSANATHARVQLTSHTYENPKEPPMFCMLMRKHLLGARIQKIEQINGDRILAIYFETRNELGDTVVKTLYLEIMGRHSNLILVDSEGKIIDAIKHVNSEMSRVRVVLPGAMHLFPPAQDKLTPYSLTVEALIEKMLLQHKPLAKAMQGSISGLANVCTKALCAKLDLQEDALVDETYCKYASEKIVDFYNNYQDYFNPVTLYDDAHLPIHYFPFPYATFALQNQLPKESLSKAMDTFFLGRDIRQRISQKSAGMLKQIKTVLERTEKKKAIMLESLTLSEQAENDKIMGELITANLHAIKKGQTEVVLQNYYDVNCADILVALDERLTPAQNAQAYYKKYRKAKMAKQYAKTQLVLIEKDLLILENALEDLDKCTSTDDLAEIKMVMMQSGFLRPDASVRKKKKIQEGKSYRFTAKDGTVIEVGKNAIQNDRLTLHARGNETWLHAQGIPGSHVLIRTEATPSDEALLLAAKLAVYYSKGRNHPQMAVDYTKRKYVKKPANGAAGFVTYTQFQTIITGVTPEEMAWIVKESNT